MAEAVMPRVMLVYPHDFTRGTYGSDRRVLQIARWLRARGHEIDLLALRGLAHDKSLEQYDGVEGGGLISRLYTSTYTDGEYRRSNMIGLAVGRLFPRTASLLDLALPSMRLMFKLVVEHEQHGIIILPSVCYARLFHKVRAYGARICLADDLCSRVQFTSDPKRWPNYGAMLTEELYRFSIFDRVAFLSHDDRLAVRRLMPGRAMPHLPHFTEPSRPDESSERDIDALFIGSGSRASVLAFDHLTERIFPALDPSIRVAAAGGICEAVQGRAGRAELLGPISDADALCARAKCLIAPYMQASGMKIGIVEAMGRGLPVVTTSHGADGLPDKTENGLMIADSPERFVKYIEHICSDDEYRARRSAEVSRYHRRHLSPEAVEPTLERLFLPKDQDRS